MHLAEAVPTGAKQFGAKTEEKMRTTEFKHTFKKSQEQNTASKQDVPKDKGFKSPVEKDVTAKKEQVNNDIKKTEQQKAIKTWESFYKKSWSNKK